MTRLEKLSIIVVGALIMAFFITLDYLTGGCDYIYNVATASGPIGIFLSYLWDFEYAVACAITIIPIVYWKKL